MEFRPWELKAARRFHIPENLLGGQMPDPIRSPRMARSSLWPGQGSTIQTTHQQAEQHEIAVQRRKELQNGD